MRLFFYVLLYSVHVSEGYTVYEVRVTFSCNNLGGDPHYYSTHATKIITGVEENVCFYRGCRFLRHSASDVTEVNRHETCGLLGRTDVSVAVSTTEAEYVAIPDAPKKFCF